MVGLSLAVPLLLAELALRPFTDLEPRTRIFRRDPDLGWTMVPGARDLWSGVTVTVNERGLRGPAVEPARDGDALRILYLGDSVTFGFGIERHEDTYPYQVAPRLEAALGRPVETVNAAVSGYSPWQQRLVLEREGPRYAPDLVVVGFVLNDVTEKLGLARFGGTREGWQLEHTATSALDALLSRSALAHQLSALVTRVRLGADPQAAARTLELAHLHALLNEPERPEIESAWRETLANLDAIVRLCRERDVPVLLVVFPLTAQLEKPGSLSHPQEKLAAFAAARDVPVLDLLPHFVAELEGGRRVDELFLDWNHPTEAGNRAVAGWLAPAIERALRE